MRKKIVAGNWKMNKSFEEGLALASEIVNFYKDEVHSDVEAVLIPPFIHLVSVGRLLDHPHVQLGAQNCHQEVSGAYTGEVSAAMLTSAGAQYVILGHSERRQYFGEEEGLLAKKIRTALAAGLKPIYCVGETKEEREDNSHFDVIESQVEGALSVFSAEELKTLVIAYEPVWAIGTGLTASPEQAQEVHAFIRNLLEKRFGASFSQLVPILYGGSVNPTNAAELFSKRDIDGGLVGGASLKSRDFINIIQSFV